MLISQVGVRPYLKTLGVASRRKSFNMDDTFDVRGVNKTLEQTS